MAYDDKQLGNVLPTRTGPAQGAATERKLLDAVGGAAGIRSRTVVNADGSTTLLRTRAGMPEFSTAANPIPPGAPCIRGPFEEVDFSKRKWHDARPDLVSSDGLFKIKRAPLRKIALKAGQNEPKKAVEIHFASPSLAGQLTAADPLALAVIEPAYGNRLWHPKQMGRIVDKGLYFCMSRLRAMVLTCKKTNGKIPFTWWFSKETDPALSGGLPICLNQNAVETGLSTRLLHGLSQIKQFALRIKTRAGNVITASPGGFLGGLDSPPISGESEFPAVVNSTGQPLNNLSTAHSCGQPWHGWMTDAGIETHTDPTNFPLGRIVKPDGYVPPLDGDTHYFAIPGLPDVSDAVPDDFAYEGMSYLKDVVFFSYRKYYSPITSFQLGPNNWLYYKQENKKTYLLRVEVTGVPTGQLANYKIFLVGEFTVRGVVGEEHEIGNVTVSAPSSMQPEIDYLNSLTEKKGALGFASTQLTYARESQFDTIRYTRLPLNTSPSGDKVLLAHCLSYGYLPEYASSYYGIKTPSIVTALVEVTIAPDLSGITQSVVWEQLPGWVKESTLMIYYPYPKVGELLGATGVGDDGAPVAPGYYYDRINGTHINEYYSDGAGGYQPDKPASGPYTKYGDFEWYRRGPTYVGDLSPKTIKHLVNYGYSKSGGLVLTEIIDEWTPDPEIEYTETLGEGTLRSQLEQYTPGSGLYVFPYPAGWTQLDGWGLLYGTHARKTTNPSCTVFERHTSVVGFYAGNNAYWFPSSWQRHSNNVVAISPGNPPDARTYFVTPESAVQGSAVGYYYAFNPQDALKSGQACYDPRNKELRWAPNGLGYV